MEKQRRGVRWRPRRARYRWWLPDRNAPALVQMGASDHAQNIGPTELILLALFVPVIAMGLVFFLTKLLGRPMALVVVATVGVAVLVGAVTAPSWCFVVLIIALPLAVGIVRLHANGRGLG